jgi:16S rRNA G527 N7-methylase RsmG
MAFYLQELLHRMVTRETSLAAGLTSLGLLDLFADPSEVVRLLVRFSELLTTDAVNLGLIGPREIDRIVDRHILDSAALLQLAGRSGVLIDVGSGAGLPGLVLAVLRSSARRADGSGDAAGTEPGGASVAAPLGYEDAADSSRPGTESGRKERKRSARGKNAPHARGRDAESLSGRARTDLTPASVSAAHSAGPELAPGTTILIEPRAKAASFLRRAVRLLGVEGSVMAATAEAVARSSLRDSAESVIARAVAPPSVSLELTLPLTSVGGRALIPVGELDQLTLEAVALASEALGGGEPALVPLEVPGAEAGRWVMIIEKARSTPERYPRRLAVSRRRPLGGSGVT